jgi:flagellar hook-associated protein 2
VSFADNSSSIKTAAQDLTDALNELVSQVNTATDPLSGDLATDPGAKSLKRSLSQLSGTTIMENAASGAPKTLADLGISIQRDGTFALDSSKLSSVLASNPTGVAAMFTNGIYGIYATVDKLNRQMASSTDANSLASSVNRYTKAKTQVTTDLSDIATKQETLRQTLVTRFSKTQTNVAASTSTMTFLKNQIDAWNSSSN